MQMACLLFFLLLLPTLSRLSVSSKISYADHCASFLPLSATVSSASFLDTTTYLSINNGYFSGENNILGSKSDHISTGRFYFYANAVYRTKTDGLFRLEASLTFEGRAGNYSPMKSVHFGSMIGFWSRPTAKICMVGTSTPNLFAVFKINYPSLSNISTSVVTGTVESIDTSDDSSHHSDTIAVMGYATNNYSYTQIHTARVSCSQVKKTPMELVGFEPSNSLYLQNLLPGAFILQYERDCSVGNCSPFSHANNLEILPSFMVLNEIYSSDDGNVHFSIGFSNTSSYYYTKINPGSTLVGEGYWDPEKKSLCLVACPVLKDHEKDLVKDSLVGECTIGLSFWFPAVRTIKERSNVVGSIWSMRGKSDPGYFRMISFRSLETNMNEGGSAVGLRYEYTKLDIVMSASCQRNQVSGLGTETYPDGSSMTDLRFNNIFVKSDKIGMSGHAMPLTFGDNFYGNSFPSMAFENFFVEGSHNLSRKLWNVSYTIVYYSYDSTTELTTGTSISAEGIYNAATGTFCLVGCSRNPSISSDFETKNKAHDLMDCEIGIDMQLSPSNLYNGEHTVDVNVTRTRHLKGTIRSTRRQTDPLFFEPLEIFSNTMYGSEATESVRRMDMEVIMSLVSLTLSCVFTMSQLFHVKKHKDVLPSISITMLVMLTLSYICPLVLNFEAFLTGNRSKQNVLMWSGGWLEANEVIVRVMTMAAFLLQFRILQLAWTARSSDESKNGLWAAERRSLMGCCLPVYLSGALLVCFVQYTRSYNSTQAGMEYYGSVQNQYHVLEGLMSYVGLILDGYLLPQIILNIIWNSKDKALSPLFYMGITAVRSLPHLYDAYRANHYIPLFKSSYIYANPGWGFYSSIWDMVVPIGGVFFAILIFSQQRFGGSCFIPHRFRKPGGYETVPVAGP